MGAEPLRKTRRLERGSVAERGPGEASGSPGSKQSWEVGVLPSPLGLSCGPDSADGSEDPVGPSEPRHRRRRIDFWECCNLLLKNLRRFAV